MLVFGMVRLCGSLGLSGAGIIRILRGVLRTTFLIKVLVRVVGHIWTAAIAAHEVVISPDDHLTVPPWLHGLAHDGAKRVGRPDLRAGRFGLALAAVTAMTALGMA